MLTTYVVAISAMLFAAVSIMTWIYTVDHLDEPDVVRPDHEAAA